MTPSRDLLSTCIEIQIHQYNVSMCISPSWRPLPDCEYKYLQLSTEQFNKVRQFHEQFLRALSLTRSKQNHFLEQS